MSIYQSDVVDSIGIDPIKNEVQLIITDHLDWTGDDRTDNKHMYLLQEKINAYLCFIESGEIYTTYPQARGNALVLELWRNSTCLRKPERFSIKSGTLCSLRATELPSKS